MKKITLTSARGLGVVLIFGVYAYYSGTSASYPVGFHQYT